MTRARRPRAGLPPGRRGRCSTRIDVAFAGGQVTRDRRPQRRGQDHLAAPARRARFAAGGEVELDGSRSTGSTPPFAPGASPICRRARRSTGRCWAAISSRWAACRTAPISAGRSRRPTPTADRAGAARASTARRFADRRIDALSQGERARLLLARVLATEADVMLADEPVASLDPAYALDAMTLLRAEAARGVCVVVSLHDLGLAARFADRVIVLARRPDAADGPAARGAAAGRDRPRLWRRFSHRHHRGRGATGGVVTAALSHRLAWETTRRHNFHGPRYGEDTPRPYRNSPTAGALASRLGGKPVHSMAHLLGGSLTILAGLVGLAAPPWPAPPAGRWKRMCRAQLRRGRAREHRRQRRRRRAVVRAGAGPARLAAPALSVGHGTAGAEGSQRR